MQTESLFDPIPIAAIREARSRLALEGKSIEDWALENGFRPKTVYNVTSGRRMAVRGLSLKIAIKLGLRPDPSAPANGAGSPPDFQAPTERTIRGRPPIDACDRRSISQLGEAVS